MKKFIVGCLFGAALMVFSIALGFGVSWLRANASPLEAIAILSGVVVLAFGLMNWLSSR